MARLHVSIWRRRRRERRIAQAPDQSVADADIARFDGEPGLWRLLTQFPPRQRVVIVLRYYCDLPDEEIAEALGVSRGMVRSQAARARQAQGRVEPRQRGRQRCPRMICPKP